MISDQFTKWILGIAATFCVMGVAWTGGKVNENASAIAVLSVQIEAVAVQVTRNEARTEERYTKTDAVRDLTEVNRQLADLRERMRYVERGSGSKLPVVGAIHPQARE